MSRRRVVVTGLGIVSPLGNDLASSWDGIVHGRSGIGPVDSFDRGQLDSLAAAYAGLLRIRVLDVAVAPRRATGRRRDASGSGATREGLRRLGIRESAQILVRPDGHVAFRREHTDLADLNELLRTWLGIAGSFAT